MPELFVGRQAELERLDAAWVAVLAGNPRLVCLCGEAGVGKSAVVRRWVDRLDSTHIAIVATADASERDLEYGVLGQLGLVEARPREDPLSVGGRLLQGLGTAAEDEPLVLVVDDIQDGDPPSLRALSFAVRRLRADRVLSIVICRPAPLPPAADSLHRRARDEGGAVELAGLDVDEVLAYVAAAGRGSLSRRDAERLRAHTDGNPLHLAALCRELTAEELRADQLPAPRSFSLLVATTLAGLPGQAQGLARSAAVLSAPVAASAAARMAGVTDVMACADVLADAGLLRPVETGSGWELRWVHPLVRAAVYGDLGASDRIRLHRAAAELTGGLDSIEHLLAAALGPDEGLARRLQEAADDAAAAGRLRVSASLLVRAHRVSGSAESAATRLTTGVDQLLACGDVASAVPLMPALAALPQTAERLCTRARVAWMTGDSVTARQLAQQSWEKTEPQDASRRGVLATMLAQIEILDGHRAAALEWADLTLSQPSLSIAERSQAQVGAVLAMALDGRVDAALSRLDDLPEDPSAVAVHRHGELRARGFAKLVGDDASGAAQDLLAVAAGIGLNPTPERIQALAGAADAEYRTGAWDAALAHANQAVSLAEDAEQVWALVFVHCMSNLVLAARGLWREAESHIARGEEVARMVRDEATNSYLADARVHLDLCRGDPGAAVEHGRATMLGAASAREPGVLRLPVNYAAALVSLGRLDEAQGALAMFEDRALATGRQSRLCGLARVRGELATARRDTTAARAAFHEALGLSGRADALEVGLVHLAHGRFLRRRGERRSATEELDTARRLLDTLQAAPWVQRCDAELGLLGHHHAPAGDRGERGDPLTPQERLVAELVCEGQTNQMVATHLVLSVKTVGYHLSNVYTKLDVHSRTQLAAHPTMRRPILTTR